MLLKNGKELDLKKDDAYKKFLDKVNQIGFPLKIVLSNRYLNTVMWRASDNSIAAPKKVARKKYLKYVVEEHVNGENIQWAYSKTRPKKKDGEYILNQGDWFTQKVYNIPKKDVDKAFFLLEIYERINKKGMFILDDPKLRARELAASRKKLAGLDFYIYDEKSPLLTANKLETVAKSLGVVDVEKMDREEVQNELYDLIKYGDTVSYDEFVDSLDLRYLTTVKAQIQEAIDKKVIDFDEKLRVWIWLDDDFNKDGNICPANTSDKKKRVESLLNYLMAHPETKNRLDISLGGDGVDFNVANIDGYAYKEKLSFAKKIPDFNPIGKTEEVIDEELIQFYS